MSLNQLCVAALHAALCIAVAARFARVPHAARVMQHHILSLLPRVRGWGFQLGVAGGCRPTTMLQVGQLLLRCILTCLHFQFLIAVMSPCVRPTCTSATLHSAPPPTLRPCTACGGPALPCSVCHASLPRLVLLAIQKCWGRNKLTVLNVWESACAQS